MQKELHLDRYDDQLVAGKLCPTNLYPHSRNAICGARSPISNWLCWGVVGHLGPHAAHVGGDRAFALWGDWTEEEFEAMKVTVRLLR